MRRWVLVMGEAGRLFARENGHIAYVWSTDTETYRYLNMHVTEGGRHLTPSTSLYARIRGEYFCPKVFAAWADKHLVGDERLDLKAMEF